MENFQGAWVLKTANRTLSWPSHTPILPPPEFVGYSAPTTDLINQARFVGNSVFAIGVVTGGSDRVVIKYDLNMTRVATSVAIDTSSLLFTYNGRIFAFTNALAGNKINISIREFHPTTLAIIDTINLQLPDNYPNIFLVFSPMMYTVKGSKVYFMTNTATGSSPYTAVQNRLHAYDIIGKTISTVISSSYSIPGTFLTSGAIRAQINRIDGDRLYFHERLVVGTGSPALANYNYGFYDLSNNTVTRTTIAAGQLSDAGSVFQQVNAGTFRYTHQPDNSAYRVSTNSTFTAGAGELYKYLDKGFVAVDFDGLSNRLWPQYDSSLTTTTGSDTTQFSIYSLTDPTLHVTAIPAYLQGSQRSYFSTVYASDADLASVLVQFRGKTNASNRGAVIVKFTNAFAV